MITERYQKAIDALQLSGLDERTSGAVRTRPAMLCQLYDKTPDEISETGLRRYFLHRRNHDQWARHRQSRRLFAVLGRSDNQAPAATRPMPKRSA
jgi:hypothetical protein